MVYFALWMKCRDLGYFHPLGGYLFWCVLWLVSLQKELAMLRGYIFVYSILG